MPKNSSSFLNNKIQCIVAIIVMPVMLVILPGCASSFGGPESVAEAATASATTTAQPPSAAAATTTRAATATPRLNAAVTSDETPSPNPNRAKTSTPAPTKTPTAKAVIKTSEPTRTPVQGEVLPSPTATNRSTDPASASQSEDLLPAPEPLEPVDGMVFSDLVDASEIMLRWSALKPTLSLDELYLITISYNYQGQIYTDYAWTQQSSWSVGEHSYLSFLSEDGLFIWSVKLIRQTGTGTDGVPQGPALSQSSQEQSFVWQTSRLDDGSGTSIDDDDDDDNDDDDDDDDDDYDDNNGGGGYP